MFQLQERVENKSSQANEWEKQTDNLRRELSDKTHRLQQTEHTLAYAKEVLSLSKHLYSNYKSYIIGCIGPVELISNERVWDYGL